MLESHQILLRCRWILAFLLATILSGADALSQADAQEATKQSSENEKISAVDQILQQAVERKEVVGVVGCVVQADGVRYLKAFGKGSIEPEEKLKTDQIFWIASMSKPVAGVALLQLQDQGKIDLDDQVAKYLPELTDLSTADGKRFPVTLRQLISHTSGMAELPPDQTYTSKTLAEAVSRYRKLPLLFQPGSRWQYSQTSINTAARVVEVVSGLSYDRYLEQSIFVPMGMEDTGFYLSESQCLRLAKSYRREESGDFVEQPIFLLAGHAPTDRDRFPAANGGLFSTANDYAKLCQMLLGKGRLGDVRILSESAVEEFRRPVTGDLAVGFTPGNAWGIGCCVVQNPQGVTQMLNAGTFGHGGAYGTQAWIDPVAGQAMVLMTQRTNFPNADGSLIRQEFQDAAMALGIGKSD
ncbi:MAG: serine hydrolase domain-containing protein [Pirellulaceae bacterium]